MALPTAFQSSFSASLTPIAAALLLALSGQASGADDKTLGEVRVEGQMERADGPIQGYRAIRSATFTKTDTPLKEVPASVSVIGAELIKDQQMQSLADVFRYVPGATTHQGEGNRDQVVLRGISTSADFYVDGIRDDAQVFRDLYNLERVEVLKGTGGMIFGRGGAGGVVNRVSKKPVFSPVGEFSVTLGSYNQLRTTLDVGGKASDTVAWRINAMGEKADSFRDGADMQRYAVNPSVTFLLSTSTALTVGYEHLYDDRTADRGVPSRNGRPFADDITRFFGNADQSQARSTVDGFYAILDHDLGGGTQVRNSFRITHYDKFYQNVYPATGTAITAGGVATLNAYNNANDRTNFFNQTDLTTKFATGGLEHTLLAGLELGHQDSTNKRNTGFFNPAACLAGSSTTNCRVSVANPTGVATSFRPNGTDADNNIKADIVGLYIQDQLALNANWKVLAGLRYDYFKSRLDDRRTTLSAATTPTAPADLARTDREFSPRLGLIWAPTPSQTYYASYSYSFLPSAETLGLAVLSNAAGQNSANFKPETATNYEIGGRWDVQPELSLSAAVFQLTRDNVRNAVGGGFFEQVGQQKTDGVELSVQGQLTRQWQVYGGYSRLDGKISKASAAAATLGHRPQLEPENTFSLWNRYDFGNGWASGLGLIHQGRSFTNVDNLVELPAFNRVDGALYYTFAGGKTRIAANIENLTDKHYFPTADANNNISPGAPRTLRLTLSTRF